MENYIIYRAHTANEIYECSYSLLKYLTVYNVKPPINHTVVIYTNQPALLENYGSYFQKFELNEVQELNTSRLALLRNFFQQHEGNALFFNTNTYCTEPLDDIFADIAKGAAYVLKWNAVLPTKDNKEKNLKTIHLGQEVLTFFPDELNKWNDSVIGLNSDKKNLLSEVIAQSQQETIQLPLPVVEKWIFHHKVSQLDLKTADRSVAQYDDLKEFRDLLRKFFMKYQEESVPNLLKLIHNLDAALIQKQKQEFQRLPLHQKLIKRIIGNHWSIEKYKV